jgi:UDP-N-acetylmuramoyl-tripeptide--D-alanyl-D-alanine ligase
MGITRIIREELTPEHKYFVVEMGAYGPGSIARLCKLTPPDMGIITAIGHAHYERFKTLENVAAAKYELAEAVIAKGGMVIAQERTLRFEHARNNER